MGTRTYRPTAGVRRYLQPLLWTLRRLHEDTWERYPGRVPTTGENSLFAIKIESASLFAIVKTFFPYLPLSQTLFPFLPFQPIC